MISNRHIYQYLCFLLLAMLCNNGPAPIVQTGPRKDIEGRVIERNSAMIPDDPAPWEGFFQGPPLAQGVEISEFLVEMPVPQTAEPFALIPRSLRYEGYDRRVLPLQFLGKITWSSINDKNKESWGRYRLRLAYPIDSSGKIIFGYREGREDYIHGTSKAEYEVIAPQLGLRVERDFTVFFPDPAEGVKQEPYSGHFFYDPTNGTISGSWYDYPTPYPLPKFLLDQEDSSQADKQIVRDTFYSLPGWVGFQTGHSYGLPLERNFAVATPLAQAEIRRGENDRWTTSAIGEYSSDDGLLVWLGRKPDENIEDENSSSFLAEWIEEDNRKNPIHVFYVNDLLDGKIAPEIQPLTEIEAEQQRLELNAQQTVLGANRENIASLFELYSERPDLASILLLIGEDIQLGLSGKQAATIKEHRPLIVCFSPSNRAILELMEIGYIPGYDLIIPGTYPHIDRPNPLELALPPGGLYLWQGGETAVQRRVRQMKKEEHWTLPEPGETVTYRTRGMMTEKATVKSLDNPNAPDGFAEFDLTVFQGATGFRPTKGRIRRWRPDLSRVVGETVIHIADAEFPCLIIEEQIDGTTVHSYYSSKCPATGLVRQMTPEGELWRDLISWGPKEEAQGDAPRKGWRGWSTLPSMAGDFRQFY